MTVRELLQNPEKEAHEGRFNTARTIAMFLGHDVNPIDQWDEWQPDLFRGFCQKCGDSITVDISKEEPHDLGGPAISPPRCKGPHHE